MHEVSIAISLIERVVEECRKGGFSRVKSVSVEIGRASGVLPDALSFSFDALKTDTIASEARLIITEVPVRAVCSDCGYEFASEGPYVFNCPLCLCRSFKVISGRELNITEIEVD